MSVVTKVYKYKEILEKGDELCRYVMVEDRGDRALYREIAVCHDLPIKPTSVKLKSDLIEA